MAQIKENSYFGLLQALMEEMESCGIVANDSPQSDKKENDIEGNKIA